MPARTLSLAALLVLAIVSGARPLAAQGTECRNPQTQMAMNHCAQERWRAADADLNAVYARLRARLAPPRREKLREAQLAWLRFRDQHCDYERAPYAGGSIQPLVYYECLASATRQRTAQLREALERETEG